MGLKNIDLTDDGAVERFLYLQKMYKKRGSPRQSSSFLLVKERRKTIAGYNQND